jgi:hypothetical protein
MPMGGDGIVSANENEAVAATAKIIVKIIFVLEAIILFLFSVKHVRIYKNTLLLITHSHGWDAILVHIRGEKTKQRMKNASLVCRLASIPNFLRR